MRRIWLQQLILIISAILWCPWVNICFKVFHWYYSSCSLQYEGFLAFLCNLHIYLSERSPHCTIDPFFALTYNSFMLNRFHPWTSIVLGFLPMFSPEPIFYMRQLQQLSEELLWPSLILRPKLVNLHRLIGSVKKTQIVLGLKPQLKCFNFCKIFSKARNRWLFSLLVPHYKNKRETHVFSTV